MEFQLPQLPGRVYKERDYSNRLGEVNYLSQKGLNKQLIMPRWQFIIMIAFAVVGVIIGVYLCTGLFGQVQGAMQRAEAATETNLTREVSYDLPQLQNLVVYDDASMKQSFVDAGLTTYLLSDESDVSSFNLAKLPADVTVEEAAVMYTKGIANLGAADAAKLLKGSWTLYVDHEGGTSYRLRYTDFDSGSAEAAVDAAITAEGFDPATVGAENQGVDDAGNTYKAGTVVGADGNVYNWRVSAIDLSEIYGVSGLPEDAMYVGIRLTA